MNEIIIDVTAVRRACSSALAKADNISHISEDEYMKFRDSIEEYVGSLGDTVEYGRLTQGISLLCTRRFRRLDPVSAEVNTFYNSFMSRMRAIKMEIKNDKKD